MLLLFPTPALTLLSVFNSSTVILPIPTGLRRSLEVSRYQLVLAEDQSRLHLLPDDFMADDEIDIARTR